MNRKILLIGIVILILLGVGGVIFLNSRSQKAEVLSSQTTNTQAQPKLEIFSGDVQIKLSGSSDFVKAEDKQDLTVGSVIKTGADGRAQILYPTNSVTRIDFNSQVTVEEFTQNPSVTKVKVDDGRIWSRVAKLFGKDDSNESETDTLVASVRGTSYGLGILTDGNNKITVTKSTVNVLCNSDNTKTTDVTLNNKLITKCEDKLTDTRFDDTDLNDEWIKFNQDQDKILDERFPGAYNDEETPSPSPTPVPSGTGQAPIPAVKGISTVAPTPTQNPTPTPSPSPSPSATPTVTPTPTPTMTPTPTLPSLTITRVSLNCSNRSRTAQCKDGDYSIEMSISGSGFNQSLKPSVYLVNVADGSKYTASNLSFDGTTYVLAKFFASFGGTYEVHYLQNSQDVKYSQTISLP